MKTVFTSLLLVFSFNSFSQSSAKFYFDEAMHPVSKKKAVIYGTGKMDSGFYQLTCYYLKRKNPRLLFASIPPPSSFILVSRLIPRPPSIQ